MWLSLGRLPAQGNNEPNRRDVPGLFSSLSHLPRVMAESRQAALVHNSCRQRPLSLQVLQAFRLGGGIEQDGCGTRRALPELPKQLCRG